MEDDVVPVALRKPFGLEHLAPAARALRELEADALLRPFELGNLHFFKLFYAALHLARLRRLVAEALDEFLNFLYFLLLLLPLGFEARAALLALGEEFFVAAGVEMYFAVRELRDGRHHVVEETAVVRDRDYRAAVVAQPRLEPLHALGVEVVRRLVEQKYVRVRQQQRRERDAHLPAARELRRAARSVALRRKAEPLHHLLRLDVEAEAALRLELALEPVVLREQRLHRVARGRAHALLAVREPRRYVRKPCALAQVVEQHLVLHLDEVLRQIADGVALRHRDASLVVRFAREDAQQRRLARAVAADEADAALRRDEPVYPAQHLLFAEAHLQALYLNHRKLLPSVAKQSSPL